MTTETLPPEEAVEASNNGTNNVPPAPIVIDALDERETVPRFGDPRDAVVTIVRDRLERMLQPVDDDPVWHGVNVITAKDLVAATAEPLPPASIFAASVRTPAYIYVDAVCPVCNIAGSITLEIDAKLTATKGSRKLQLAAKATALPHVCGQKRLELGGPSRPARGQTALDLGDDDSDDGEVEEEPEAGGNPDPLTGFPEVDGGNGREDLDETDVEATDRDAIHTLAAVKPAKDEPDDLSDLDDLPF